MSKGPKPPDPPHNASDVGIEWRIYSRLAMRRIPEDEPIFVIRASDRLATRALATYRQMVLAYHRDVDNYHAAAVLSKIRDFEQFQTQYPERMEAPGEKQKEAA